MDANAICYVDLYILELHMAIAQNRYETHSMHDITHTNASQLYHMNSFIDIHKTHFFIAVAFTKIAPCERALIHKVGNVGILDERFPKIPFQISFFIYHCQSDLCNKNI